MSIKIASSWVQQFLSSLRRKAKEQYRVDPAIFVGLYLFSFVPFYLGLLVLGWGAANDSVLLVVAGLILNRAGWALPYLYALFWGTVPRRIKWLLWAWLATGLIFGLLRLGG